MSKWIWFCWKCKLRLSGDDIRIIDQRIDGIDYFRPTCPQCGERCYTETEESITTKNYHTEEGGE